MKVVCFVGEIKNESKDDLMKRPKEYYLGSQTLLETGAMMIDGEEIIFGERNNNF